MLKLLTALTITVTLTGCYALKPVAWVAEDICTKRTVAENALLAEKVDKATYPHSIRVQCYSQVKD